MPRPPGRDQTGPMERLVRLIGALNQHRNGTPVDLLLKVVAPDAVGDEARRRMLSRDLDHLNNLGYDIRNVAEQGSDGKYVMRARDNRLQVHLSAEQRGELLRAAIAAGLEGMAGHLDTDASARATAPASAPADLDLVQRGTTRHCLVRFTYKGEPRVVHPVRVHSGPSGWYLTGREVGGEQVKEFVVSRMSDIELDPPGSAETGGEPVRRSLDPLTWEVDPPTDVVLRGAGGAPGPGREPARDPGHGHRGRRRPHDDVRRDEPPGLPLPGLRAGDAGPRRLSRRRARRDPGRAAVVRRRRRREPGRRLRAAARGTPPCPEHPRAAPAGAAAGRPRGRARRRAAGPARGLHGLLHGRPGRARQPVAAGHRVLRAGRRRRRRATATSQPRSGYGCSPPTRSTSSASTT